MFDSPGSTNLHKNSLTGVRLPASLLHNPMKNMTAQSSESNFAVLP